MKYPTMTSHDATKYIELVRGGQNPSPSTYVKHSGSGTRLSEEVVSAAVEVVRRIRAKFGDELKGKDGQNFEREAGEAFRKALDIPPEVAGDSGFWRYVAAVPMYDIVIWRHPPKKKEDVEMEGDEAGEPQFTKLANFGIGGRWENLAARMWFRFEVARIPGAADPYELCRLGDQDLWRSHILRIRLGASRHVVRTLLAYQYPQKDPSKPRLPMSSKKDRGIRLFIKRLQRFHATTAFEVLTEDDALEIMEGLGKDLLLQAHDAQGEIHG